MIVPDVNLLVYAYDSKAPHHPRARAWWEGLLSHREPVGIPWVVSVGFVRIMTSRSVMTEPMAPGLALTHVRSWLALPSVDPIQPGPRHLDILASFAQSGTLVSALMTDAHIAAIAVELQATVHSNDTDVRQISRPAMDESPGRGLTRPTRLGTAELRTFRHDNLCRHVRYRPILEEPDHG